MNVTRLKYKKFITGYVSFDSYGDIHVSDFGETKYLVTKNNVVYFNSQLDNIKWYLEYFTNDNSIDFGDQIFISPECSVRRDLYRETGYKITIKPEKADKIVVPRPKVELSRTCDFIAFNTGTGEFYEYNINHNIEGRIRCGNPDDIIKEDIEKIKKRFEGTGVDLYFGDWEKLGKIGFYVIKDCQYYPDIFVKETQNNYVMEHNVEFHTTEINLETLTIWHNIDDNNLLDKALCKSNWQKYPFTLVLFLKLRKGSFYAESGNCRWILDQIGFKSWYSLTQCIHNMKDISAEDWNLSQEFLVSVLCGTGNKDGGVLSTNINFDEQPIVFLKHQILVKPVRVNKPVSPKEILRKLNL